MEIGVPAVRLYVQFFSFQNVFPHLHGLLRAVAPVRVIAEHPAQKAEILCRQHRHTGVIDKVAVYTDIQAHRMLFQYMAAQQRIQRMDPLEDQTRVLIKGHGKCFRRAPSTVKIKYRKIGAAVPKQLIHFLMKTVYIETSDALIIGLSILPQRIFVIIPVKIIQRNPITLYTA